VSGVWTLVQCCVVEVLCVATVKCVMDHVSAQLFAHHATALDSLRGLGRNYTCLFSHACGCAPALPLSLTGTRETSPCPRPARCRTTWCPAPRVADASTRRLLSGTSPSARTSRPRRVDVSLAPVHFQPDTPHIPAHACVHHRLYHVCALVAAVTGSDTAFTHLTLSPHGPHVPRPLARPSRPTYPHRPVCGNTLHLFACWPVRYPLLRGCVCPGLSCLALSVVVVYYTFCIPGRV
jgi:hypothetical protein